MDFKEFSKKTTGAVEKELAKLLKEWRSEVKKIDVKLLPLLDKFIISCNGGKRIRGNLVVLGYWLGQDVILNEVKDPPRMRDSNKLRDSSLIVQNDNRDIYKIAAAYEMLHSAVLAHDDIIDQSVLRRGRASLYKAFGGNHYGVSQAISLGDAVFFLAFKILSESSFDDNKKNKAVLWLAKTLTETAIGEMLDVERGDAVNIMKLKTARYSVSGPLILGAILVGADQKLINKLETFGDNLGIAFQIQDDILGIFGKEKITGKSVSSDIEEGKNTILFTYALKNAEEKDRQLLEKFYGRGKIGNRQQEEIKQVFRETGALDYAINEAEKYRNNALNGLSGFIKDQKWSKIFEQLAEYLVQRTK